MQLPWWALLAYAVVKLWFVTIPVAIALALAAWYGAPWLGGLRWILIAAVIVLALPFPMAAGVVIYQTFDATGELRPAGTTVTIDLATGDVAVSEATGSSP